MQKSRGGKDSRAREKHESKKSNQVTRINPSEKTSMAEFMCEACLFLVFFFFF